MKKVLFLILVIALFAGCATKGNPNVGPAIMRIAVSTGAAYALMDQPSASGDVRIAAQVICATAHGTNISPAAIVAALDASGDNSTEARLLIMSAINIYTLIWNSNTNQVAMNPYAEALCGGLTDALAYAGTPASMQSMRRNTPAISAWPQMRRR